MKVIQIIHTVRIALCIEYSGPVVECLNKKHYVGSRLPDRWHRTPDMQNYAYSMENLYNYQNAPASDLELFCIKGLLFYIFSSVSINLRHKQNAFNSFKEKNYPCGLTQALYRLSLCSHKILLSRYTA